MKSKYVLLSALYSLYKCASSLYAIPAMCSFDSSTCDFTNNEDQLTKWVRMKATQAEVDHTCGTENGESHHTWRENL